ASDDPLVEVPGIGKLPASVAWRYMKDDKTQDKDVMVDPDGPEGPLPPMPSQHAYHYMNQGAGKMSPHVQQALDYFTAMAKQTGLDPKDAILLAWKPELKEMIQRDMDEQAKAMYDLMASIIMNEFQGYYDQQIGGNQDPMGIR
nr:hypothetical protein [Phycisphaerae bacterium]